MRKILEDNLTELFSKYKDSKESDLKFIIDKIVDNVNVAEKKGNRFIVLFFFVWFITWAIAVRIISEIQITSIKFSDFNNLIVISPFLLGFLYYQISIYRILITALDTFIKKFCQITFSNFEHQNIFRFLLPVSYSTIEDYILFTEKNKLPKWFAMIASILFYVIIWIIPIFAFLHSSYLAWVCTTNVQIYVIISIILGLIFGIRSIILWISNWQ